MYTSHTSHVVRGMRFAQRVYHALNDRGFGVGPRKTFTVT
jgi:hypothetical protein